MLSGTTLSYLGWSDTVRRHVQLPTSPTEAKPGRLCVGQPSSGLARGQKFKFNRKYQSQSGIRLHAAPVQVSESIRHNQTDILCPQLPLTDCSTINSKGILSVDWLSFFYSWTSQPLPPCELTRVIANTSDPRVEVPTAVDYDNFTLFGRSSLVRQNRANCHYYLRYSWRSQFCTELRQNILPTPTAILFNC